MDEDVAEQGGNELGFELSFLEARVLGSLLEKEATTPGAYPMTLNGLQAACNQKSSREPVSDFDEATVERGIEGLRGKHLAVKVHLAGSRAPKYKHSLGEVLHLEPAQQALLTVLLLRGVQTAGELNQRTERIHAFGSVERVEAVLESLIDRPAGALVRKIPPGGGRRVTSFAHLLSGEPEVAGGGGAPAAEQIVLEEEAGWRSRLEGEVQRLRGELDELRERLEELRREWS